MAKTWQRYICDASGKIIWAESWATGLTPSATCPRCAKPTVQ